MAPMRREVSLIIRKPQLVGCQWILQPPAAVQQGARGPPASLQGIGAGAARREYPELLLSCCCRVAVLEIHILGCGICAEARSITFQAVHNFPGRGHFPLLPQA